MQRDKVEDNSSPVLTAGLNQKRLALFPVGTTIQQSGEQARLTISGYDLQALAEQFGTPLYLYHQATLEDNLQIYHQALAAAYPGPAGITFAGKAYLSWAFAQWANRQGIWLDCSSRGEMTMAAAAGTPPERIVAHGVNKGREELEAARKLSGHLVVDNLPELERILGWGASDRPWPNLWLRWRPGLAVDTHAHVQTGQEDSKFGMSTEEIKEAVRLAQRSALNLTGLHFHLGSQFRKTDRLVAAIRSTLDLLAELQGASGWFPEVLCPGGGWGVPYHEDDLPYPSPRLYVRSIAREIISGCRERGLPIPRLQLEPGRSLAAQAGVAIYQVRTVKHSGERRWLLIDGGLSDNPRPALYGARYTTLPLLDPYRPHPGLAWIGGPYCESGDLLIAGLPMPEISPGEFVAVPVSGAYQLSMSSNYNGALRPAVVWLGEEQAVLIQRRETPEDLLDRDLPLENF